MIDINKLALAACMAIGKPFDEPTKKLIIEFIDGYRSRFLRDTITSNKVIPNSARQTIHKRLEKTPVLSNYYVGNTITSMKTIDVIDSPIRINTEVPFIKVTSPSGQLTFANAEIHTISANSKAKFTNNNRYVYDGGCLYLYSNEPSFVTFAKVKIISIFENPYVVDDDGLVSYDIFNYPLPRDMANMIINEIITKFFNMPIINKEVKIDDQTIQ